MICGVKQIKGVYSNLVKTDPVLTLSCTLFITYFTFCALCIFWFMFIRFVIKQKQKKNEYMNTKIIDKTYVDLDNTDLDKMESASFELNDWSDFKDIYLCEYGCLKSGLQKRVKSEENV